MAKEKNIETLSKKARRKKDFLIVAALVGIGAIILSSFLMYYLDGDRKEQFVDRKKIENKKDFEIIKQQDLKETWAISIENRIEDQDRKRVEAQKALVTKTEKELTEVKNLVVDSMADLSKKFELMSSSVTNKMADLEASAQKRFNEQQSQIDDLSLRESDINSAYEVDQRNIILGSDLLPPAVETSDLKKNEKESVSVEDSLSVLTPEKKSHTAETKDIKKTESKPAKAKPKKLVRKRVVLNTVSIDVTSSVEEIDKEEKEYAELQELKRIRTGSLHIMTGLTQAYMITGAYAPAFEAGDEEPLPVLFQAEGDILIANNDTESIDKCLLIGSAKGNMNSQTADIRLHSITCSLADGTKMVEGEISGWVIGENGIPGVQGDLMHKNGAWLSKTFVSGFLETFSNAFSDTGSTEISFGTDGTTSVSDSVGSNVQSAAAGGLSTVFGKLGEYYLKMAEQIFPVIEVKGGRTVNILLKGGEDLVIKDFNKFEISEIEEKIETEENFIKKVGLKKYNELNTRLGEEEGGKASSEPSAQEDLRTVEERTESQLNNIMKGRN